jgi:RNA polymerase sigma-70 factor (ECF subfamily)
MRLRAQKPVEPLMEEADSELGAMPVNVVPWMQTPEELVAQGKVAKMLEEAIGELPESLGLVFQLRDIEGRSTAETAQILGATEGAVKVRLHRARLALRERLSDYFGERVPPEASNMTCEQLVRYLSAYIDAELDEPLSQAAQEHLATCRHCHLVLDTTHDTIVLFRGKERQTIPLDRRAHLFRDIERNFAARSRRGGQTAPNPVSRPPRQ